MHLFKLPHKVPVALTPIKTARPIAAAYSVKDQAALSVAYGAGLRASEVAILKPPTWTVSHAHVLEVEPPRRQGSVDSPTPT